MHGPVLCASGAREQESLIRRSLRGRAQAPPTPPVDPDNVEFVLFIRAVKFPQWYPLSVVKGGSAANLLTRAMEYEFGRMLYGKTLIRNIGQVGARFLALQQGMSCVWGHCSPACGTAAGRLCVWETWYLAGR
jgi:hypothetical protein